MFIARLASAQHGWHHVMPIGGSVGGKRVFIVPSMSCKPALILVAPTGIEPAPRGLGMRLSLFAAVRRGPGVLKFSGLVAVPG